MLAYELFASRDVSCCIVRAFQRSQDELGLDPTADSSMGANPCWEAAEPATPIGELPEATFDLVPIFE